MMPIDFRLKWVLKEYRLDNITNQELAKQARVERHKLSNLTRNNADSISFSTLAKICSWLIDNGVPSKILPGILFGLSPSKLWEVLSKPGRLKLYVGEYQETKLPTPAPTWISRRDSRVESLIISRLARHYTPDQGPPAPETKYVPFRFRHRSSAKKEKEFQEDIQNAKVVFDQMKKWAATASIILIGSQKVNYLLEFLVSDLFDCKPFTSQKKPGSHIPFYLMYRDQDHAVVSCFGGMEAPYGYKGDALPGLYYRDEDDNWHLVPWEKQKQFSGVIITMFDIGTQTPLLALWGFTGIGTEILGQKLAEEQLTAWPPNTRIKGKEIGIFIYQITINGEYDFQHMENTVPCTIKTIPIHERVLKNYLK